MSHEYRMEQLRAAIAAAPKKIQKKGKFFYTVCGFLGISSLRGDGNIHRDFTVFLSSANTFTTDFGSIIVRIELLVLGSEIIISPFT